MKTASASVDADATGSNSSWGRGSSSWGSSNISPYQRGGGGGRRKAGEVWHSQWQCRCCRAPKTLDASASLILSVSMSANVNASDWMEGAKRNVTKRNVAVVTHSQNHNYTHIVIRIRTRIHIRFHFLVFVILHALVVAHVNRIYIVLSPTEMLTKQNCAQPETVRCIHNRHSQWHSQHSSWVYSGITRTIQIWVVSSNICYANRS